MNHAARVSGHVNVGEPERLRYLVDLRGCRPGLVGSVARARTLLRTFAGSLGFRVDKMLVRPGAYRQAERIGHASLAGPGPTTADYTVVALGQDGRISMQVRPAERGVFIGATLRRPPTNLDGAAGRVMALAGAGWGRGLTVQGSLGEAREWSRSERELLTMMLEEEFRPHEVLQTELLAHETPFQTIRLYSGPFGIVLLLNDNWQVVEAIEREYHELLVHPAFVMAPDLSKVGVGGGGDGLTLREVVRWPEVKAAVQYEIDPYMLHFAAYHPEMRRLNEGALVSDRVEVKAEDANNMLAPGADYSVLILDFPSISDGAMPELYQQEFYRRAAAAMRKDGVLVTQVSDYQDELNGIIHALFEVFAHVLVIDCPNRPYNFVIASHEPFVARRALPHGVKIVDESMLSTILGACRHSLYNQSSYWVDLRL
jgi:spermidine synthase